MTSGDVTVVAPVYNNAATLPELCRRIRAALGSRLAEIILVDDGSTDGSPVVMAALDVHAIVGRGNRGQNTAILDGLTAATSPICCVLDADLEDPPEALPDLVARLDPASACVVFSSRHEARPVSSRVFRLALQTMFPSLPAHPCLCFAVDGPTRTRIVATAMAGDYLPAVIGALGVPAIQVAVARGLRPAGASGYTGTGRLRYATRVLWSACRIRARAISSRSGRRAASQRRSGRH